MSELAPCTNVVEAVLRQAAKKLRYQLDVERTRAQNARFEVEAAEFSIAEMERNLERLEQAADAHGVDGAA